MHDSIHTIYWVSTKIIWIVLFENWVCCWIENWVVRLCFCLHNVLKWRLFLLLYDETKIGQLLIFIYVVIYNLFILILCSIWLWLLQCSHICVRFGNSFLIIWVVFHDKHAVDLVWEGNKKWKKEWEKKTLLIVSCGETCKEQTARTYIILWNFIFSFVEVLLEFCISFAVTCYRNQKHPFRSF